MFLSINIAFGTRTLPTLSTGTPQDITSSSPNQQDFRLLQNFKPTNYTLDLDVFFETRTSTPNQESDMNYYSGIVDIKGELTEDSNIIIFNINENIIKINQIIITRPDDTTFEVNETERSYKEFELYEIKLSQTLVQGTYTIRILFTGNYGSTSNIVGFYKTSYLEDGVYK